MSRDFVRVLKVLSEHRVRFVLIGGMAAVAQGSPVVTYDVDICYDLRRDNLEQLAGALQQLHARLRGVPEGLPFILDAETLGNGDFFTFDTDAGAVDILGTPSGAKGYDDLRSRAVTIELGTFQVPAAAIGDLIAMKHASARDKDGIHLLHLEALRDELERP
jgi:hypothetical protein